MKNRLGMPVRCAFTNVTQKHTVYSECWGCARQPSNPRQSGYCSWGLCSEWEREERLMRRFFSRPFELAKALISQWFYSVCGRKQKPTFQNINVHFYFYPVVCFECVRRNHFRKMKKLFKLLHRFEFKHWRRFLCENITYNVLAYTLIL